MPIVPIDNSIVSVVDDGDKHATVAPPRGWPVGFRGFPGNRSAREGRIELLGKTTLPEFE